MPRPLKGRVGRSAGVAEHRVARHRILIRLSRTTTTTRISALACVVALAIAGAPSGVAQAAPQSVAGARAAIDTTADQWFAAQTEATNLDLEIETLTKTLAAIETRVGKLREVASARAVQLYESNTQTLAGVIGESPIEIGRRAALIAQANTNDQEVIDQLESSIADLTAQRADLRNAQRDQEKTLEYLASRRSSLDAQLAALEVQATPRADRSSVAEVVQRGDEPATTAAPTRPATVALTSAPAPAPSGPVAPPDTGAVSAHHNNAFLVCTRARESNGDYAVASSAGYYGAYQFAPTTWNVTASHAGRLDLVGVLPSHASAYDQDELAWSLYQWQGNGPWGGRC